MQFVFQKKNSSADPIFALTVVRRGLHGFGGGCLLLSAHQRFCWIPIRRRWHTSLSMGTSPFTSKREQKNLTSPQFLRIACLLVFAVSFFISIATFKQKFGFNYTKPIALFIIYLLWPLICVPVYIVSQLILVFRTLDDRWPIGDIIFGTAFFAGGQVLLFAFSTTICDAIKHYIDGLFFFTLCVLLSVMMVYKYWDDITVSLSFLFTHLVCSLNPHNRKKILNSLSVPKPLFGKSKTPSSHRGREPNTTKTPTHPMNAILRSLITLCPHRSLATRRITHTPTFRIRTLCTGHLHRRCKVLGRDSIRTRGSRGVMRPV